MLGERWGVTDDEVARHYPCDDLVATPALEVWRGVTVHATPERVWPWVRQIRLAPYSYDLIDNMGKRSPRELRDLPEPQPGDPFSCVGGRRDTGRVLAAEPGVHLTAEVMGAVMSYLLVPSGDATRLLLKVVAAERHWWSSLLAVGDWPMARRQLLNLKQLAEAA